MKRWVMSLLFVAPAGCGGGDDPKTCNLNEPVASCGDGKGGQVCEDVAGTPACVAPVVARGRVSNPAGAGIGGALVTALDGNEAPATGTAVSGSDGAYELRVPAPRAADGTPLVQSIKLRASAAGYETFPGGLRRSLPLALSGAVEMEGRRVLRNSATDVVLFPLAGAAGLGTISGVVAGQPGKRGALVVAEGGAQAASAVSDVDGAYTIFNVPPGSYEVRGYAAGVQLTAASAMLAAGHKLTGVDLAVRDVPLGAVAGAVNIVNAPGGSQTSVVLVVASTFNEALKRGDVPPGLRAPRSGAPAVSGAFTIDDVPDGKYVVLAAFENDGLVRDPDPSIGGTQIQRVQIGDGGRQATLAASFKVTEALQIMSPGSGEVPEAVSGAPTFVWKDDSSEDRYALEMLDARGNTVWSKSEIGRGTGTDVRVGYDGPALSSGTLYQFRATSFRKGGTLPISQTEDLRGVFLAQ
jgi:hypothetical protein